MRIHRDPHAGAGGGLPGSAAAGALPAEPPDEFERRLAETLVKLGVVPGAPPGGSGAAPLADQPAALFGDPSWERVQRSELEQLRATAGRLKTIEAEKQRAEEEQRIKAGKWEEIVKEYKDKLAAETIKLQERDRAFKSSLRDREIAAALASHPLVSGAARQLLALVRDQFDVHDEAGQLVVKSRGFEPVDQAVKALLATAEYAHFLRATSQGGAGATGATGSVATPPPTAGGPPVAPTNLAEAVIQRWQARRLEAAAAGGMRPIGLGGRIHTAGR
jgi:hypothetical protein